MNKHVKKSDWKRTLKEMRSEYRTVSRPCLSMATEQFNDLMREYHIIKPKWSYKKRKQYLQWIIDANAERKVLTRTIIYSKPTHKKYAFNPGPFCDSGSHHCLDWLDGKLDDVLDKMGLIDLS